MSGRSGRSGQSKEWTPFAPTVEAPALDGTIDGNLAFCAWVAFQKSHGYIDARDADALSAIARVEITAIRARFSQREVDDLRKLVERQEKAIAVLTKAEQTERYSAVVPTATVSLGRVRSPDGDPH